MNAATGEAGPRKRGHSMPVPRGAPPRQDDGRAPGAQQAGRIRPEELFCGGVRRRDQGTWRQEAR